MKAKENNTLKELKHIVKNHDNYEENLKAVFQDANAKFNDRISAGLLLTGFELGIRSGDLCGLFKDCLRYDPQGMPYVNLKSADGISIHNAPFVIYCNPELEQRLKELLKLREQCPYAEESPFLYVLDKKREDIATKPVNQSWLSMKFKQFCGQDAKLKMLRLYHVWKLWTSGMPVEEIARQLGHKFRNSPYFRYRKK